MRRTWVAAYGSARYCAHEWRAAKAVVMRVVPRSTRFVNDAWYACVLIVVSLQLRPLSEGRSFFYYCYIFLFNKSLSFTISSFAKDLITIMFSKHSCIKERTTPWADWSSLWRYLKCLLYIFPAINITTPRAITAIVNRQSMANSTQSPAIKRVSNEIEVGRILRIPSITVSTSEVNRFMISPEWYSFKFCHFLPSNLKINLA